MMYKIFNWAPHNGKQMNFGDELGPWLIENLCPDLPTELNTNHVNSISDDNMIDKHVFSVGSLLPNWIHDHASKYIVLGTGVGPEAEIVFRGSYTDIDWIGVRGPLSAKNAGLDDDYIIGDPALITPLLLNEKLFGQKKHKVSYVAQIAEVDGLTGGTFNVDLLKVKFKNLIDQGINVISPTLPFRKVIKEIVNSEVIISSSLHGIIIADAYDIPVIPVQHLYSPSKYTTQVGGKYQDYFLSTRGTYITHEGDVYDAISSDNYRRLIIPRVDKNNLEFLQDRILQSFDKLNDYYNNSQPTR